MVELVWQEGKLANASLEEFQFWTESWRINLVNSKEVIGAGLLDLRVS